MPEKGEIPIVTGEYVARNNVKRVTTQEFDRIYNPFNSQEVSGSTAGKDISEPPYNKQSYVLGAANCACGAAVCVGWGRVFHCLQSLSPRRLRELIVSIPGQYREAVTILIGGCSPFKDNNGEETFREMEKIIREKKLEAQTVPCKNKTSSEVLSVGVRPQDGEIDIAKFLSKD